MKMITIKDAAGMAGVSVVTMHRWIKAGWGPPYHVTPTRTYRLAESDVLSWLASLKHKPAGWGNGEEAAQEGRKTGNPLGVEQRSGEPAS
jgi:hypothetical protein